MKLGDFFKNAPLARPVNPKPITFTAMAKGEFLPGGIPNPTKRMVAASITGALVFLGGTGIAAARRDARKVCEANGALGEEDFYIELTYQQVWLALREWDPATQTAGDRLFPDAGTLAEMLELTEANRILGAYNAYVKSEHPEGSPDDATF